MTQLTTDILHQAAPLPLCQRAVRSLPRMYIPQQRQFCFTLRRAGDSVRLEGVSRRYTATVLIGLSRCRSEWLDAALAGDEPRDLLARLEDDLERMQDIGEVALTLWAARAWGDACAEKALRRLRAMNPATGPWRMVELAWCLSALTADGQGAGDSTLASRLAERIAASTGASGLMPHWPIGTPAPWLRAGAGCFADQVYPIQALSFFSRAGGKGDALRIARRCAAMICTLKGAAGQWWWHYDTRTGRVIEGYPVYSVHQDGMAPMALGALQDAGGGDFSGAVEAGLCWLAESPEIGGSLIDEQQDVIWRKVARCEPLKLARRLQAGACRIHRSLRVPGLDWLLPARAVDWETRPYHMGWILYAWGDIAGEGSWRP